MSDDDEFWFERCERALALSCPLGEADDLDLEAAFFLREVRAA